MPKATNPAVIQAWSGAPSAASRLMASWVGSYPGSRVPSVAHAPTKATGPITPPSASRLVVPGCFHHPEDAQSPLPPGHSRAPTPLARGPRTAGLLGG